MHFKKTLAALVASVAVSLLGFAGVALAVNNVAPQGLVGVPAFNGNDAVVNLTWTWGGGDETRFVPAISEDGQNFVNDQQVVTTTLSHSFATPKADTKYWFKIIATSNVKGEDDAESDVVSLFSYSGVDPNPPSITPVDNEHFHVTINPLQNPVNTKYTVALTPGECGNPVGQTHYFSGVASVATDVNSVDAWGTYADFGEANGSNAQINVGWNKPVCFSYTSKNQNNKINPNWSASKTVYSPANDILGATVSKVSQSHADVGIKFVSFVGGTEILVRFHGQNGNPDTFLKADGSLTKDSNEAWIPSETFGGDAVVRAGGLVPATTYDVDAKIRNHDKVERDYTSPVSFTTVASNPVAPESVAAVASSFSRIDLSWAPGQGQNPTQTGYAIEQSVDGQNFNQINSTDSNTTKISVYDLKPNTRYWFRVAAFDEVSTSSYAVSAPVYTYVHFNGGAPTASVLSSNSLKVVFADLVFNDNPAGTPARVTFDDGKGNISYLQSDGTINNNETWVTIGDLGGANGKVVTGFLPDTYYSISLNSKNGDGVETGQSSLAFKRTFANTPNAPTLSKPQQHGFTITIDPSGNPANTEFLVYNATTDSYLQSNGAWVGFPGQAWGSFNSFGGANGVQATGLDRHTKYVIEVKARNRDNAETIYGSPASIDTLSGNPIAPVDVVSNAITESTVQVNWSPGVGVEPTQTGYAVEQSTDGKNYVQVGTAGANSQTYTFADLLPNTQYWFRVAAFDEYSTSSYAVIKAPVFTVVHNGNVTPVVDPFYDTGLHLIVSDVLKDDPDYTQVRVTVYEGKDVKYLKADGTLTANSTWITYGDLKTDNGGKNVIGLVPNTSYGFVIDAKGENGDESIGMMVWPLGYTLATKPGSAVLTNPAKDGFKVTFDPSTNSKATEFLIHNITDDTYLMPNGTWTADSSTAWSTYDDFGGPQGIQTTGLKGETQYSVEVKARNTQKIETGYNETPGVITTGADHPVEPTSLGFKSITSDTITIQWSRGKAPGTETAYAAEISTDGVTYEPAGYVAVGGGKNPPLEFTFNVKSGTKYYVGVDAVDGNSTSTMLKAQGALKIDAVQPAKPVLDTPVVNAVDVNFGVDNNDDSVMYALYDATDKKFVDNGGNLVNQPFWQSKAQWGSKVTVTGLNPNTEYKFQTEVKDVNNFDNLLLSDLSDAGVYTDASVPGKPIVTNADPYSVTVAIDTANNGVDSEYALYDAVAKRYYQKDKTWLKGDANAWQTYADLGEAKGVMVDGFVPGQPYKFEVKTRNIRNQAETALSLATDGSVMNGPVTPDTITVKSNGTTIDVSWSQGKNYNNAPGTETHYVLEQSIVGGKYSPVDNGIVKTSYQVTNLKPDTQYTFRVSSADNNFTSPSLESAVVKTSINVPPAPFVALVDPRSVKIFLTNDGNDADTEYVAYDSITKTYLQPNGTWKANAEATGWISQFDINGKIGTGFSPFSDHSIALKARNKDTKIASAFGDFFDITTQNGPAIPANFTAVNKGQYIALDWQPGTNNGVAGTETGNNIELSTDAGNSYQLVEAVHNVGGYNFGPLKGASEYRFRINSVDNKNIASDYAYAAPVVVPTNEPGQATLSDATLDSFRVTIDTANNDEQNTSYLVNNITNGKYLQANGTWGNAQTWLTYAELGGANGIVTNGLEANTDYSVQVKAKSFAGQTVYGKVSDTITTGNRPATPIKVALTNKGGNSFELSWQAGVVGKGAGSEDHFVVEESIDGSPFQKVVETPDAVTLSATFQEKLGHAAYQYRVASADQNTRSEFALSAVVTSDLNTPNAVQATAQGISKIAITFDGNDSNVAGTTYVVRDTTNNKKVYLNKNYVWQANPVSLTPADLNDGNQIITTGNDIVAGSQHAIDVQAENSGDTSSFGPVKKVTMNANAVINDPMNATAQVVDTTHLSLSWTAGNGDETVYSLAKDGNEVAVIATTKLGKPQTSYAFAGLTPNTAYTLSVAAADGTATSSHAQANALYTAASTPTNLNATVDSDTQITLDWAGDATEYYVTNGNDNNLDSGWQKATSFVASGLSCNTEYTFKVKGQNADGLATSEATVKATTQNCPAEPVNLNASVTKNSATASWDMGNKGTGSENSFTVGYSTDGQNFVDEQEPVVAKKLSYTHTFAGLDANTTYTFRVKATDAKNKETNFVTYGPVYTLASDPSNLKSTVDSGSQITLDWAGDATEYYVTNAKDNNLNSGWIKAQQYVATGLMCNNEYTFAVKGRNGDQVETGSVQVKATTAACPMVKVPADPTNVVASVGTDTATLNWNQGMNGSEVKFVAGASTDGKNYSNAFVNVVQNQNAYSTVFNGLTANTRYWFRVASLDVNAAPSNYVTTNAVYTLANTPKAPMLSNATETTLDVAVDTTDQNPNTTQYSIKENGGLFVQANGTLGAVEVFDTAANWGTKTVSGLVADTQYAFTVIAKNGDGMKTGASASATLKTNAKVVQNAAPTVAQAPAANPSPVVGASTNISVLGADDNGEQNLIYIWQKGAGPGNVTFGKNNSNDAKNTTAQFDAAGDYKLVVVLRDQQGLMNPAQFDVTVKQTPSLTVAPANVSVEVNKTQQFTVSAVDQFKANMVSPSVTWSVSGGQTIDAKTGVFTAGANAGGPYMVTADDGAGHTATALVTVTAPVVVQNNTPVSSGGGGGGSSVPGRPVITVVVGSINTQTNTANLKIDSSNSPTLMMVSSSSSFTSATWVPFNASATWNFGSGSGTMTVYAKAANGSGESPVGSASFVVTRTAPAVAAVAPTTTPVVVEAPVAPQVVLGEKVSLLDELIGKTKYGQKSDDVKALQTELKTRGYFAKTFKPTNFYGSATKAAVEKYLAEQMSLGDLVKATKYGQNNYKVFLLQGKLKEEGLLPQNWKPTYYYGVTTRAAVKKYLAE